MLLGLPPDMVHGASLHRTRTPIFRMLPGHTPTDTEIRIRYAYYTTPQNKFQVFFHKKIFLGKVFLLSVLSDADYGMVCYHLKVKIIGKLLKPR